jgi:hypothetical protein
MDVARFLALASERKVYFKRRHDSEDWWEGARRYSDPLVRQLASVGGLEAAKAVLQALDRQMLISCWHENEVESVAMWKLYVSGREGVAI